VNKREITEMPPEMAAELDELLASLPARDPSKPDIIRDAIAALQNRDATKIAKSGKRFGRPN
jgi:hypothetical protein